MKEIEFVKPEDIEKRSFEIIAKELAEKGISLPAEQDMITRRVIHTSADFEYAHTLTYSENAVAIAKELLKNGADIVTDTNMGLSGVNKTVLAQFGGTAHCFMADPDVAKEAKERGQTRAYVSMERALALPGSKLLVCGNAPTFLFPLLQMPSPPSDIAVVGVPVGFVNVVEAKERLWESGIPCIAAMGRRGGSNVAAAIVNALLYGIPGVRP